MQEKHGKAGLIFMRRLLPATALLLLLYATYATADQPSTTAQLAQAEKAFDEGLKLTNEGRYAEAQPLVERALGIWESTLGEEHLGVALALNTLARIYLAQGLYSRAESLLVRSLRIVEATLGGNHPVVATALNDLAFLYQRQGRYADAEPLLMRTLKISEATLGENHPKVATALNNLANLYANQGFYARAEPLLTRALRIWKAALGEKHPKVALALNNLAGLYKDQGLYARADALYALAIKIWEAALGESHPDVATALDNLARLYLAQGFYARAEPLATRALKIQESTLGETHPEVAKSLNTLARIYLEQGLYARAEPLFERSLKIMQGALGEDHPLVASAVNDLASLYQAQGLYAQAEPFFIRALKIWQATLGEVHPDVATALNNLAGFYANQGLYERAESLLEDSLQIRKASLGENHPDVAASLNNLASLYMDLGFYGRAEPLLTRAVRIGETALGENHPRVAELLSNLARLYLNQGDYARAEPLFRRSLEIGQATLGENHPQVATSLNDLANLYQAQGSYSRAEALLTSALQNSKTALGEDHPRVAIALNNLAFLYKEQGLYKRAEPLYAHALRISEKNFGESHPDVATALNNLAVLYKAQGLYARAEPLYARSLGIWEKILGENHPTVATSLGSMALLHLAQQRLDKALPLFQRALASSEQHLRQETFAFSEKGLFKFLELLRLQEDRLYSLAGARPRDPRVVQLALSAALLRQGRSAQEVANTSLIVYRSLNQSDRKAFEELRGLRTQLASLYLAKPDSLSSAAYEQRIKELTVQGDLLEADLARRSEPLRRFHELPSPAHIISRVSEALPSDGALVEFVLYQDQQLGPRPRQPPARGVPSPRYLAFLLFPDGRTRAIDLGPAEPIDRAAVRLHDALASESDSYLSAAQELYGLTFRSLVPHLGKTQRLFLTPDGQLNLVPFAAFHDGKRFLVEAFHITYLTSGKEVMHRPVRPRSAASVIVMADPAFGSVPAGASLAAQPTPKRGANSASLERFFSTLRSQRTDTPWGPLPNTRTEAEAIRHLLPQAQLLMDSFATKQALLNVSAPGILHIATHGFFLKQSAPAGATRAVGSLGAIAARMPECPAHEPLLCSGLVLAGASASEDLSISAQIRDSWVTALELAGLDLWGTQLVVLSACDTGRGEIQFGQGVAGLRRAFLEAGSETLVASLWKVSDKVTRELMERYYRHLLTGQGRSSALREAMKELRNEQPHPHFWAPFIALGQDAPLQGFDAVPNNSNASP